MPTPEVLADMYRELLAQPACRDTFQAVHQPGELYRRREMHEEVDVVVLPVELCQGAAKVLAHLGHHLPAAGEHRGCKGATAVLGHEHQVSMALPYCVPATPDGLTVPHDTNMVH